MAKTALADQEASERLGNLAETAPMPGPTLEEMRDFFKDQPEEGQANDNELVKASGVAGAPPGWLSRCELARVANFRDSAVCPVSEACTTFKCAGGRVKSGLLFRTGLLATATAGDLEKIRDVYKVKTYIDLRLGSGSESAIAPCYDVECYSPCPSGRHDHLPERQAGESRRVHIPLATKDMGPRDWTDDEKSRTSPLQQRTWRCAVEKNDRRDTCSWWWQRMIRAGVMTAEKELQLSAVTRAILFINHDKILKAMQTLKDSRNYPVAYGCMAGKDRTGVLGLLVFEALGVSREDIFTDYLATNASSAHISACVDLNKALHTAEVKERKQFRFHPEFDKQYEALIEEGEGPSTDSTDSGSLRQKLNITSDEANLKSGSVSKGILQYVFHVLDNECGGGLKYLDSIGFGASDVERMREILVEKE